MNAAPVDNANPSAVKRTVRHDVRVVTNLLKPHRGLYATILGLCVLEALLGGLAIASLFPMFESLVGINGPGQGGVLGWVGRVASRLPIQPPVAAAAALLVALAGLKCAVAWTREILTGYATARVNHLFRIRVLAKYVERGFTFFMDQRQGELIYNLHTACFRASHLLGFLPVLTADCVHLGVLVVLLYSIHANVTTGLLLAVVVIHLVIARTGERIALAIGRSRKAASVTQQVLINEFINGFKQIVVFGVLRAWIGAQDRQSQRLVSLRMKEAAVLAAPRNVWELLVFTGGAIALVWAGPGPGTTFSHEIASFGVYLVALQRMLPYVSNLGRVWIGAAGFLPDAYTVEATLRHPPVPRTAPARPASALAGGVRFERVGFSYPDRAPVLRDASFTLEKGKTTAIVGISGAGKTTILNLLLGMVVPTSGTIWIDDVDLRTVSLDSWLSRIGFVSQDVFIFNGTIRENIAFARATADDEVEEAAFLAHADDFVREFPEGYDTIVGDRGMKISGGQQQRIALARAILKRPDVLIFDEPTSSLDAMSEGLIQDSLRKIGVGRTVIVVAHRLSTIVEADKIVVLKDGTILGEGTHAELLKANGYYGQLYGQQGGPVAEERLTSV